MNSNSNRNKVFKILNMITAILGGGSLAYIYYRVYPYLYHDMVTNTSDREYVFVFTLSIVMGVILVVVLLANAIGAFSAKANNKLLEIEGKMIWIPISEIVFLIIMGCISLVTMIGIIIVDVFELSGWVIVIYPILFLFIFGEIGFTLATKFKLLDYLSLQRKTNMNYVMQNINMQDPTYNNAAQSQTGSNYPQYPQQSNPQYPQYQQQNYPQYPQATQDYQAEINSNNNYSNFQ